MALRQQTICSMLEGARWLSAVIGIQLSYYFGNSAAEQLHLLSGWLVIPIAGLSGIESLLLAETAGRLSGYGTSPYQRQSGLNNLALALTGIAVYLFNWGSTAELTILTTLLLFLFLSGCNHAWSFLREGNLAGKNMARPLLTLVLIASCLPILIKL
ncbi:DUF6790 family protein [Desulfogranum mediterraneum]|uniref:DUF6790 family protein n=1 Tax=Desulfogranum mediterraneum TaxID=160661 RepID=UPI000406B50B|nr:DUF6790 family protein [Desulfogranum mediterraneum]